MGAEPLKGSLLVAVSLPAPVETDLAWIHASSAGMSLSMSEQSRIYKEAVERQQALAKAKGHHPIEKGTLPHLWRILCGGCKALHVWRRTDEPPICASCRRPLWDASLFRAARMSYDITGDATTIRDMLNAG